MKDKAWVAFKWLATALFLLYLLASYNSRTELEKTIFWAVIPLGFMIYVVSDQIDKQFKKINMRIDDLDRKLQELQSDLRR